LLLGEDQLHLVSSVIASRASQSGLTFVQLAAEAQQVMGDEGTIRLQHWN
jgi:hypothetical protein